MIKNIRIELERDYQNEISVRFRMDLSTFDKKYSSIVTVFQEDMVSNFDQIFDILKTQLKDEILGENDSVLPDEKWNENVEICDGCGIQWKKIGKPCPICYHDKPHKKG